MIDADKYNTFYLIPKEVLDDLLEAIKDLREMRDGLIPVNNRETLGDYITEEQAMELLGRGKTWFHNHRKSGVLSGRKAANKWFYKFQDIKNYIDGNTI